MAATVPAPLANARTTCCYCRGDAGATRDLGRTAADAALVERHALASCGRRRRWHPPRLAVVLVAIGTGNAGGGWGERGMVGQSSGSGVGSRSGGCGYSMNGEGGSTSGAGVGADRRGVVEKKGAGYSWRRPFRDLGLPCAATVLTVADGAAAVQAETPPPPLAETHVRQRQPSRPHAVGSPHARPLVALANVRRDDRPSAGQQLTAPAWCHQQPPSRAISRGHTSCPRARLVHGGARTLFKCPIL